MGIIPHCNTIFVVRMRFYSPHSFMFQQNLILRCFNNTISYFLNFFFSQKKNGKGSPYASLITGSLAFVSEFFGLGHGLGDWVMAWGTGSWPWSRFMAWVGWPAPSNQSMDRLEEANDPVQKDDQGHDPVEKDIQGHDPVENAIQGHDPVELLRGVGGTHAQFFF